MPFLDIDISDAVPSAALGVLSSEGLIEAMLDDLGAAARAKWVRIAGERLSGSAPDYVQSIQEVEVDGPGARSIALVGWLANAIENGLGSFDMRDTILRGANARPKTADDGTLYQHVPFRHGTPGTTGLAGTPMGEAYGPRGDMSRAAGGMMSGSQAAKFGAELYKQAKKLRGRKTLAAGTAGARLLRPHHSTDIYAGMRRERKPYVNPNTGKTAVQTGGYMTFRTISERNQEGWRHPGIEPRHFSEEVKQHVERIAPAVVAQALASIGGGR